MGIFSFEPRLLPPSRMRSSRTIPPHHRLRSSRDPVHRLNMPRRKVVLASALSLLASTAHAATVGNEGFTVPPFSCFGSVAKSRFELTKAESDLSGASYDPETGNIFVVNNGDRKVYEISGSAYEYNTLVNTFDVTDLTLDLRASPRSAAATSPSRTRTRRRSSKSSSTRTARSRTRPRFRPESPPRRARTSASRA